MANSIEKYLKEEIANSNKNLPAIIETNKSIMLPEMGLYISNEDAGKVVTELSKYAYSDTFIKEVSSEISVPKENESKSEFVERGLQVIREKLRAKFKF